MASETPIYPKRPSHYAHKVVRAMVKTCVAQEHGQGVFLLVCVIAHTEDARHYTSAVTFWNEQLAHVTGFANVKAMDRQRAKAVDAGWLVYIPGGNRVPGKYWVAIPPKFSNLDDAASDEGPSYIEECEVHSPVQTSNLTNEVGNEPGMNRDRSGNRTGIEVGSEPGLKWAPFNPIPNPVPLPVPEAADAVSPAGAGRVLFPDLECFTSEEKRETPLARNAPDVQAVFDAYRKHHPRAFTKPVPASKEWRAIAARLREGFSVADLIEAIEGCHVSPFHCGENDRQTKYQSLGLIVRDGSQVSKFIELARDGPAPVLSEKTQRSQRAAQSFLNRFYEAERGEDDPVVSQ